MSLVGIGTDIVATARIRRILERHGDRFARRVLGPGELARLAEERDPAAFLARRFAAKEAAAKALGSGITGGLRLCDIEVTNDSAGQPRLHWRAAARRRARALGVTHGHVSLSDEREYAVAFVVLEAAPA